MRWWLALAASCLAACGGGGSETPGAPFGLAERVPVTGLTFPTGLAQPAALQTARAFPNLRFDRPVFLTHAPDGSGRLFVVEQGGRIYVFANDPDVGSADLFLDLGGVVSRASNEEGLLGFAPHPDYAVNGWFYVHYSLASPRRSRVSRFTVSAGDPDAADASSEAVLLEFAQPYSNHNAGMLAFGPNGMLYVATGDGGSGGDPQNNAQNLSNLLGKILRLAPDGSIPSDNPFVGVSGARGEIWAYGLRNPWRFSFDRATGTLWAGDVGQGAVEEIDIVVRGGNYGWRLFEGDRVFNNPSNLPASDFEAPVQTYTHGLGLSVTGGYVYRGSALPSLAGAYLYADFVTGRVWALVYDAGRVVSNEEIAAIPNPSSFGEDAAGEVYVCSFDGNIYRFEEQAAPSQPFPQRLSETGLFTDTAALAPAPGLIEYDVNSPFWSDGARKRRWMALPGTSRIGFSSEGPWGFPVGTVFAKHFEIELADGTWRRLETRVFLRAQEGWQGYVYRWNQAQTDADLLVGPDAETPTVRAPELPGGSLELVWTYPGRADCLACHTAAAGRVLGARTAQINREFAYPAATDNQLRAWNHIGLFSGSVGAPGSYAALPDPAEEAEPLESRARSWIDANCAHCHRPGGTPPVDLDLRYEIPTPQTQTVGVAHTTGLGSVPGALRIEAGVKESSVLWELIARLGNGRMPPLASNRVDPLGLDLVGRWIDVGIR